MRTPGPKDSSTRIDELIELKHPFYIVARTPHHRSAEEL